MKIKKLLLAAATTALISTASFQTSAETAAHLVTTAPYNKLYALLKPNAPAIKTLVDGTVDQISYGKLVTFARKLEAKLANSRVTITLPDGTAVFDGGKKDDPGNTLKQGNSYKHYQEKTITENLNTRLSNLDPQEHTDGLGAETRLSSVTKKKEAFVGIRLGAHLNNSGTARISVKP
ncbi:hypothetical protein [Methyloglobulus sp.]|uniref:hypothetical protein n=1 Tax=Methyloglobulus sp. TaxID=2518622 RepID=UPI0032B7F28E